MTEAIFALCALTSLGCAVLLLRSYRATRARLLLWSSVCFVGLAINNLLLCVDFIILPDIDLSPLRASVALISVLFINFGLIWDSK
ncbi:MAG: DUF5985 family protein [Myxococcales bacterium]|nr:DUF5985 family protein [Myxococcales bacterium]